MALAIRSTAFAPDAESLALIVNDLDAAAPTVSWASWIVCNIPDDTAALPAGAGDLSTGSNDWRRREYGVPCPPVGRHLYFFRPNMPGYRAARISASGNPALKRVMQGHMIEHASLIGTGRSIR